MGTLGLFQQVERIQVEKQPVGGGEDGDFCSTAGDGNRGAVEGEFQSTEL